MNYIIFYLWQTLAHWDMVRFQHNIIEYNVLSAMAQELAVWHAQFSIYGRGKNGPQTIISRLVVNGGVIKWNHYNNMKVTKKNVRVQDCPRPFFYYCQVESLASVACSAQ